MAVHPTVVCTVLLVLGLLVSYVYFWYAVASPSARPSPCRLRRRRGGGGTSRSPPPCRQSPAPRHVSFAEGFTGPPASSQAELQQQALDFSEVLLTEELRRAAHDRAADTAQIKTVNQRFEEAKRNVVEHRLKPGVYTLKQRRKLVENLLRRPYCGRRVRSWRTENSDIFRGDVRPKPSKGSSNLIRSAKSNPDVDLHPGALGPVAGMQGRWNSEENLPANVVQDVYVYTA